MLLDPVATTGCTIAAMAIKSDNGITPRAGQTLLAAGVVGALASSSCCILPLALFSLGVSGAWIGNLTRLAPYQPYIIAATVALLACGYWLVYRASRVECAEGAACARPLPNRLVKGALVGATVLVVVALGFDVLAPFFLDS
jgi:mercuric ion transport protein